MSKRDVWKLFQNLSVRRNSTKTVTNLAAAKRTPESNPVNHHDGQVGIFYNIPENDRLPLFSHGGFPKEFTLNIDTFCETSIMIRKPSLDIINLMKKANYNQPIIRYVLYGKPGCGKSISLAHILHYAHLNGFIILHVPWVWDWFKNSWTEVTASSSKPGLFNLPLKAASLLKHFLSQNTKTLSELDIKLSKDYIWSSREMTPVGSPLVDLVNHGINRVKYASDVIDAVVEELKLASKANKCKVLVAIDGFNSFFGSQTNLKDEDKTPVTPEKVVFVQSLLSAVKQDWNNGAAVLTLDQLSSSMYNPMKSHYPIHLLGRQGFEHIDPFIPVSVPEFTDLEFESMLDYYEDRQWLQRKDGRHELSFLSNKNPYQLMKLCSGL